MLDSDASTAKTLTLVGNLYNPPLSVSDEEWDKFFDKMKKKEERSSRNFFH